MNVSSVSPERCEMMVVQPLRWAISTDSSVSVSVPIWFTLTSTLLRRPSRCPSLDALGVGDEQIVADQLHAVAERLASAPPSRPSRSRPCRPRSTRSGTARTSFCVELDHPLAVELLALALQLVGLARLVPQLARRDVERERDVLARLVAGLLDRLDDDAPAPPRRPADRARSRPRRRRRSTPCDRAAASSACGTPRRRRAAPRRRSAAPLGTIMNSWKSSELSACAPPLMMFISGTGSTRASGPAEVLVERQRRARRPRRAPTAIETPSIAFAPTLPLFGRAVGRQHRRVEARPDRTRRARRPPGPSIVGDVLAGLAHALAEVALLVAVAQLERLVLARRRARRARRRCR